MEWGNPAVLSALVLLPLVGTLMVRARRRRTEAAARFAEPAMRGRLLPTLYRTRLMWKGLTLLAALGLLIIAAAQPRFGLYFETVPQRGVDLLVLLDVSRSMAADDVMPNRLERAKSDIRDLLAHLRSDRVGLVVFAGQPLLKVPLTNDQDLYQLVLDEVDFQSVPQGGTRIGDALRKGLQALPQRNNNRDQVLVLITDGEDHDSQPEVAARQAAERGVKIVAIGLGDARTGARIPIATEQGPTHYVTEAGQEHWSRLDEELLKELALTSHGAYVPAGTNTYDLGQVYDDYLAGLSQGTVTSGPRPRYGEQYQLFLAVALVLMLINLAIPRFPRPNDLAPCQETSP